MKSLLTKLKVQITWLLLLLLHQQLLLAQEHHDHEKHHHYQQLNHHQRHHHLVGSNNNNNSNNININKNNNNSKLTSAQLVAQYAENHHHYNYQYQHQHQQQQQQQQQQSHNQEEDREREQRHHQHHHNRHHNYQRQNGINLTGASKSPFVHQQYYKQGSTIRPLTAHHNSKQQQQQQQQKHSQHQHQHAQPNEYMQHQKHNQRHAHDQFSQTSPPTMAHKHNNFERQQRLLVQKPNINSKVVGSNNWHEISMTDRTHAHMTAAGNHVNMDGADSNYYYDDMSKDVDDYDEQEYTRVQRHSPEAEYANDEPSFQNIGDETKHKQETLGKMDNVIEQRDIYLKKRNKKAELAKAAENHFNRMAVATSCSVPLPRVIFIPHTTDRHYHPSCTILHRCGEDTGCCAPYEVCTVRTSENVSLPFFVNGIKLSDEYELLSLVNHTSCHCVHRYNMPRNKRSEAHHRQLHHKQHPTINYSAQQTYEFLKSNSASTPPSAELIQGQQQQPQQVCHCPKHFDVFVAQQKLRTFSTPSAHQGHLRTSEECRCDCLSTNLPCKRLRDGDEGFPVDDRKCIAERRCRRPSCSHGEYNRHDGRCPRHKDTRNDFGSYG